MSRRILRPCRITSNWIALAGAHNALPADHPSRRAVVLLLTRLSEQASAEGWPEALYEEVGRVAVQAVLVGPPMTARERGRWA